VWNPFPEAKLGKEHMIRILVVDDHALVRDGLCRVLNGEDDIVVVGETGSGRQAVQLCLELKPDVVLLDSPSLPRSWRWD
jgi:chemotaxis response regulator CheB